MARQHRRRLGQHAAGSPWRVLKRRFGWIAGASVIGGVSAWTIRTSTAPEVLVKVSAILVVLLAGAVITVLAAALFSAEKRVYGRVIYLIQTIAAIFTARVRPNIKLIEEDKITRGEPSPAVQTDPERYDGILDDLQQSLKELELAKQRHRTALTALEMVLIKGDAIKEHADMLAELLAVGQARSESVDGKSVDSPQPTHHKVGRTTDIVGDE